jgi:hypothetical protein
VFLSIAMVVLLVAQSQGGQPESPWVNGPHAGPDSFPRAVWLQDPRYASRYKQAGINLHVGLWRGPTEDQLGALKATGMLVICAGRRPSCRAKVVASASRVGDSPTISAHSTCTWTRSGSQAGGNHGPTPLKS